MQQTLKKNLTSDTNKRNMSLDAIKFLAIIGVLFIHSCNYNYPINSTAWLTNVFLGSVLRCAVPLFLMCSGALLLNPEKPLTLKILFTKYIPRLVAAMLIWSFFYKLSDLYFAKSISLENILKSIKDIFTLNQKFHMYYMHIIIMVYLCLPLTRILTKNMTKTELTYTLLLWFAIGILFPTILSLNIFPSFSSAIDFYSLEIVYSSIGYCILGYYLNTYKQKNFLCLISAVLGFLIVFFGTIYYSNKQNTLYSELLGGFSIGVFLLAFGIYGILINISDFGKFNGIITYISKASFCIYLVHVFFLNFLNFSIFETLPQIVSVPVKVLLNLLLSTFVYFIVSKIPIAKKYLV